MISAFAFLSLMIISSGEAETARVWIGSLPLCEATVSEVATGGPDQWGNQDVNISLHSSASAELARITQKAVGQELSVIADGEILSNPMLREPIYGSGVQIAGLDPVAAERLLSLTGEPCGNSWPVGQQ